MIALENNIASLNSLSHKVTIRGAYVDVTITNDGSNLTYEDTDKYTYNCTIDELNAILQNVTPKVEKYGAAITPGLYKYGLGKQFTEGTDR
jgi:hypothetical protein